jgi:hypothetical protein
MATIEKRRSKDSMIRYRVKIRRRGAPSISETFLRLSDTKTFYRKTEADIAAGRALTSQESKRPYGIKSWPSLHS